MHYLLSIYFSN